MDFAAILVAMSGCESFYEKVVLVDIESVRCKKKIKKNEKITKHNSVHAFVVE